MNPDDTAEFVKMVDGAWQPPLTDTMRDLWYKLAEPLDGQTAFTVIVRMFRTEKNRPAPPVFRDAYKRELMDTTPTQTGDRDRDEMPDWVRGWRLSRAEGDQRLWPEEEKGYREIHEEYIKVNGKLSHSGYEWEAIAADLGVMPQADRVRYIDRSIRGEAPVVVETDAEGLPVGL